jgi:hypothetical protein
LENYLLLFHHNHSIISQTYPSVNPLKATITSVVAALYTELYCPEKIFQISFITVLTECRAIVEESDEERILVNCLSLLEAQLSRNNFCTIFQQHKLEFVFSLFMYSCSAQEERDAI